MRLARRSWTIQGILTSFAAALLIACTGDTPTAPGNLGPPVLARAPGFVDGQSVVVGSAYPQPLGVQVTGVSPLNGQILNFVVTSGGGSAFADVVATAKPTSGTYSGLNGIGQNIWTLGPTAGPQTIEARLINPATGATMTQAIFHATGLAGPAKLVKAFAGNQQGAVAGTAVATAPAVLVTDQFGNPISGIAVTFAVAGGAGSITGASPTTGTNGIATVGSWTLGPSVGNNTLTAARSGLTGSPVTFTAVGGTGTAAQLVIQAGNGQSATVATAVAVLPAVRALDSHGNGVPGVAVTFVAAGDATVEGVGTIATLTNASGIARVTWTLGTVAGPNTLLVISPGLSGSPVSLGATGTAGPPATIVEQDGDGQTATGLTAVAIPPAVLVSDQYGNLVPNVSVTFAVASGGGSVTGAIASTDAGGIAAVGSWSLGVTPGPNALTATATGNGISGNPVTFSATAASCDCWTTRASMPTPRAALGVAAINGILYVVGGASNGSKVGTVEAYDAAGGTWTTKASLPTPRANLSVTAINGILYAVGGNYYQGGGATVEAYDPATNTWTTKASMPTGRDGVSVTSINGILYAVGGGDNSGYLATVEAYDPATNIWTTKAPMPTARYGVAVGVVNGVLYAAGGAAAPVPVATVEAYDPATNTWTTKAPMLTARAELSGGAVNGLFYAAGGYSVTPTFTALATVEVYDPATDTWNTKAPMPTARVSFGADVVDGLLYAVGGFSSPSSVPSLATVEAYQP